MLKPSFWSKISRITSLEEWGKRTSRDFTPELCRQVRDAGFTGVYVNGGSGIGPDQIPAESLTVTETIPDLMPLTSALYRQEIGERIGMLTGEGLDPWLQMWGVPGANLSHDVKESGDANLFFHRRTKMEMSAKLQRAPELFGFRSAENYSWRGSRPLCISHPQVQAFYQELMGKLIREYRFRGIFFFPGDHSPECCDDSCPRCRGTGRSLWERMTDHVNRLYEACRSVDPDFEFYVCLWNQDFPGGSENIASILRRLAPGIGISMSISDNVAQKRRGGTHPFNQPWVSYPAVGELFRNTAQLAADSGRPVMALTELAQGEEWDAVCRNVPEPRAVLRTLKHCEAVPGLRSVGDFWGHRGPADPFANLAAMGAFFADPAADEEMLLNRTATKHYVIPADRSDLTAAARKAWDAFEDLNRDSTRIAWAQRFSFAVGRDRGRGPFFQAFTPGYLKVLPSTWAYRSTRNNVADFAEYCRLADGDRERFLHVAEEFRELAKQLPSVDAAKTARREADNIELAGEIHRSLIRAMEAADAFAAKDAPRLRHLIETEIAARIRELKLSSRIAPFAGLNEMLTTEDVQNMLLYLSLDSFPEAEENVFDFSATPYTM